MRTDYSFLGASTRIRVLVLIGVVALSLWMLHPVQTALKLGLDLNGGVQLVARVKTDAVLLRQTETTAERLRAALSEERIGASAVEVVSPTAFRVRGTDASALARVADERAPMFERTSASGTHAYTLRPAAARQLRDRAVDQALHAVDRRVNEMGVAESQVARYTAADQILIQLPGVSEVDRAKALIKSTTQLELTLADQGPFPSPDAARASYGLALPTNLEILPGRADGAEGGGHHYYVVERTPALTGADLRSARQDADEYSRPAVSFTLKPDAAQRFGAITERNIRRRLATVLDNRVVSVAAIQSRIDDHGQIAGVSRAEMIEQVITLNSGALPADLEYVEERTVGASLGAASIRAGVLASLGGLGLILLVMLAYYRRAGVNVLVSVVLNLLMLLAIMAYVPVTLTLPGIAGLILTIGMGVDSNVLIFERLREELSTARGPRSAVRAAFSRVWLTIVDTHVTSLIAAALLYQFGTTPIRGFATTLAIGLAVNVFTAVFVSRTLFEVALARRGTSPTLGIGGAPLFASARANFTRWRWHAAALSALVIGAGLATVATRGLPLGIDFSGGTLLVVEVPEAGVTEERIRTALAELPGEAVVQRYGAPAERQFQIRRPIASGGEGAPDDSVREVTQALQRRGIAAVAASLMPTGYVPVGSTRSST